MDGNNVKFEITCRSGIDETFCELDEMICCVLSIRDCQFKFCDMMENELYY